MKLTVRTAFRKLPSGRILRLALHVSPDGEPLLLTLAVGFEDGGLADLVDPRPEDRLVLPASALPLLPELVAEVDVEES